MPRRTANSRGASLEQRLRRAIQEGERIPRADAIIVPILRGITPHGLYHSPRANVLAEARTLLVESGRIYRYEDSVVLLQEVGNLKRLQLIQIESGLVAEADNILANIFICEQTSPHAEAPPVQFSPPKQLVKDLLHDETAIARIPAMRLYSKRPVFDEEYRLCCHGWNADSGIYVAAPEIEIDVDYTPPSSEKDPIPRHLAILLGDFAFRSEADTDRFINGWYSEPSRGRSSCPVMVR